MRSNEDLDASGDACLTANEAVSFERHDHLGWTEGGLMRYDAQGKTWWRAGQMKRAASGATADPSSDPKPARGKLKKNSASGTTPTADDAAIFNFVVADMAFSDTRWYAATAQGLQSHPSNIVANRSHLY